VLGELAEGSEGTDSAEPSSQRGYYGQNQDLRVSIIFHSSIRDIIGPEEQR